MISECSCLKRNGSEARQLYQPVLQPHEKETAQEFLQHIETGEESNFFCAFGREKFFLHVDNRQRIELLFWLGVVQFSVVVQ